MDESPCGVWKPRLYLRKRIRRGGFTENAKSPDRHCPRFKCSGRLISRQQESQSSRKNLAKIRLNGIMKPYKGGVTMKYYSTQRPLMPGCCPRAGVQEVVNFDDKKFCDEIGCEAWGFVEYNRELTQDEIDDYELVPAGMHLVRNNCI